MIIKEATKLDMYFDVQGEEKQRRQPLGQVIAEPTEQQVKTMGTLLERLAPKNNTFESAIVVERTRYTA